MHVLLTEVSHRFEADMDEIIRFIPKSERERTRLIREARAIFASIFPRVDLVNEKQNKGWVSHAVSGDNAHRRRGSPVVIKIIDVLCSLSSPEDCHEEAATTSDFAEVSMQSCLMGAPQLAEWMKQHPAERLADGAA
jgi:hypothetical protein